MQWEPPEVATMTDDQGQTFLRRQDVEDVLRSYASTIEPPDETQTNRPDCRQEVANAMAVVADNLSTRG